MDRNMTYFVQSINPGNALNMMEQIMKMAVNAYREGDKKEMLRHVHDLNKKTKLFLKDFGMTPEETEE